MRTILLSCILLAQVCLSHSAPIKLEAREVAYSYKGDVARGLTIAGLLVTSDAFQLQFEFGASQSKQMYGLLVPPNRPCSLSINGMSFDQIPLERKDGFLFCIPEGKFREGLNLICLACEGAVDKQEGWEGTKLFSLDNTTEEVHFAEFFRDAPAPLSIPPVDSSQAKFDVLWYDCNWTPSMTASSLTSATVTMRARCVAAGLQTVVLDYDPNGFNPISAPSTGLVIAGVDQGPATAQLPWSVSNTTLSLAIRFPTPIAVNSEFQVRVQYSGTPTASFSGQLARAYTRSTHSGTPVVYTASQPYGGRRWWPCKDLPSDKATTTVQRITIPSGLGYQVVSNGKNTSVIQNGSTETWVFENSYPIVTYLVAFYVTNYTYSKATYTSLDGLTTMPIWHAIYPENVGTEGAGATGTRDVLTFFAQTFGEYPYLREKYFTATWNITFGIEHQTCTGMPAGATQGVGNGYTRRNVHELSHQWFGDKVTYGDFDHAWLGEGFATYAEALWNEHIGGSAAYHSYVNAWTYTTTDPIVGPLGDTYNTSTIYRRGAWVLHMLRHVVGDAKFFQTLKNYAADPTLAYSTALSSDFANVAAVTSGQNLTAFFNEWLYRPNTDGPALPTFRYHGANHKAGSIYSLDLHIDQTQGGALPFTMPVDIQVLDGTGTSHTLVATTDSFSGDSTFSTGTTLPLEINFDPDNWVLDSVACSINTIGLPLGNSGAAYSRALRGSGGTAPYTWTLLPGAPAWLSLSTGGTLTGTPPAKGTYAVPVRLTDASAGTCSTKLRLDVNPALSRVEQYELY